MPNTPLWTQPKAQGTTVTPHHRHHKAKYIFRFSSALLSALLFGASTPLAKLLLGSTSPLMLAGLLYLNSGFGLLTLRTGARHVTWLHPLHTQEAPLSRADFGWLALAVMTGGMAGPALLMQGLAHTDAATASLLLNLEGLATMVIAWSVFNENTDRRVVLGTFAILAGACVLSWSGAGITASTGALLITGPACFTSKTAAERDIFKLLKDNSRNVDRWLTEAAENDKRNHRHNIRKGYRYGIGTNTPPQTRIKY